MRDGTPPPPQRGKGLLSRHREQSAGGPSPGPRVPDRSRAPARPPATARPPAPRHPPASPPPQTTRRPEPRRAVSPAESTYRAHVPPAGLSSVRMPLPGEMSVAGGVPAPGASVSQWEAAPRRHGFSIFHDGNAGHLWRGEVVSLIGEGIFGVGAIMWLAYIVGTPGAIVLAALALGLPYLLAGPLAVPLQNARDPGRLLRWIGQLRAVLALGLVPMHYRTILPVVYLLLFGVSLCGRLRAGGRVAAMRVCLAPGELEHVSDDLQIGAGLATVLGPLLALVLFVGLGDRILLVSIGAFIVFLIGANSDGFLDPLPRARRAFLLARPEAADVAARARDAADDDDHEDDEDEEADPERLREELLPEWYQQGPRRGGQWLREVRDGLSLAGTSSGGLGALAGLGLLALVGGGLSVLEVFYISEVLQQPPFYLGALVAAEAAGLALGLALVGAADRRVAKPLLLAGLAGTGALVAALALFPRMPQIFVISCGMGGTSAVAVMGARALLRAGATGRQRLAIATGEEFVTALCGVLGAPLFGLFYVGSSLARPLAPLARFFPGWPLGELLLGTGMGLVGAAALVGVLLALQPRARSAKSRQASGRGQRAAMDDDESGAWGDGESGVWQSAAYSSAEQESDEYETDYQSEYGDAYGDPRPSRSRVDYGPPTGYGPATGEYDDYGDTDYRRGW